MKKILRKFELYKIVRAYYSVFLGVFSKKMSSIKKISLILKYFNDLKKYKHLEKNTKFKINWDNISPYIYDKMIYTPIDPVYFYQDSWCAKKIFKNKPEHHYDVGSKADMLGIISQFTPATMVDIRSINLEMPGFKFQKGDILSLPFKDNSIDSLSSICVIEHIGLGRYGDKLNPLGSEKAIKELKRVLSPNGNLYISVPVDKENKIYFNAHRAFTRDYIIELFKPFKLIEEKYIYGRNLDDSYDAEKGFGTGLFHFKK